MKKKTISLILCLGLLLSLAGCGGAAAPETTAPTEIPENAYLTVAEGLAAQGNYAAAIGMVAVFCGVTNCPLTSLVLGFEVFSFCNPEGFLVAVAASFLVSGYSGLYSKQKFAFSKVADSTGTVADEENINYK